MLTLSNLSLALILAPFTAGVILAAAGARLPRIAGIALALLSAIISIAAALTLAGNVFPDGPIIFAFPLFGAAIGQRLDGLSAYALVGLTIWVIPILLWAAFPRSGSNFRPMGFVLIAAALTGGALLNDNIILLSLCWLGVAAIAWLITAADDLAAGAADIFKTRWVDLVTVCAGPILFLLAMIPAMAMLKKSSLLDLTGVTVQGAAPFSFFTAALVFVAFLFALGAYPFMIWLRRAALGVSANALGVIGLMYLPSGLILFARVSAIINNPWPSVPIGIGLSLNTLYIIFGAATVIAASITLLAERDIMAIALLLAENIAGWMIIAIGSGNSQALVGVTLLLAGYIAAFGALIAVIASLECRLLKDISIDSLKGIAKILPLHFIAAAIAMLCLAGAPLLIGFASFALINLAIAKWGGFAFLIGGALWMSQGFAAIAVTRYLASFLSPNNSLTNEETLLLRSATAEAPLFSLPIIALLILSIAPQLLLAPVNLIPGLGQLAAASLLTQGVEISNISISMFGIQTTGVSWEPGLFWLFGLVIFGVVAFFSGAVSAKGSTLPVFAGGEPFREEEMNGFTPWITITHIARTPFILPGPAKWRHDLGAIDIEGEQEVYTEADTYDEAPEDMADPDAAPVMTEKAPQEKAAVTARETKPEAPRANLQKTTAGNTPSVEKAPEKTAATAAGNQKPAAAAKVPRKNIPPNTQRQSQKKHKGGHSHGR